VSDGFEGNSTWSKGSGDNIGGKSCLSDDVFVFFFGVVFTSCLDSVAFLFSGRGEGSGVI